MGRIMNQPIAKLLGILLVALIVRSIGAQSRPIWYDEAFSILFSEKGPAAMLRGTGASLGTTAAEEHPLGYYGILWAWMNIVGTSLIAARLLSILAGLGSVVLLYLTGREIFSERTGLISAALGALAPFQVHYSQEIRMYGFLCLWLLLATFAFWRGKHTGKARCWVLFAVSAALAQYTHNMAALYLIPLAATPLIQGDWKTFKRTAAGGLAAILLYSPWLVQLPSQVAKIAGAYWLAFPGFEKLFTLLLFYVVNVPLPPGWLAPGLFITLLAVFIAVFQTILMTRAKAPGAGNGLWTVYMAFAPPLLAVLISQWRPIFLERTFLASGAIFCTWLAWALFSTGLPRPIQAIITAGLITGASAGLYQHLSYAGFPYAPYRGMQAMIQRQVQPGDIIIHSSKLSLLPAVYYNRSLNQVFIADPPGGSTDTLAFATQQVLGVISKPSMDKAAEDASRVWFIIFDESIQEYREAGRTTHPQLAWLDAHFHLQRLDQWGDLKVFLYER
jgi:4-amino-4-deoxy-L-arabinose transferase-like glycosyltransferase